MALPTSAPPAWAPALFVQLVSSVQHGILERELLVTSLISQKLRQEHMGRGRWKTLALPVQQKSELEPWKSSAHIFTWKRRLMDKVL